MKPAGKSLEECQKISVLLTLDAKDDLRIRACDGVTGLRRSRILRLTSEARDQGGLLSYEDLAYRLLNCGVRTIVRDIAALRRRGLEVPTRGQQQDIGPGQTHRVQAVRLFLQGKEANEIARALYHSLSSIENYVTTFARVIFLAEKGYGTDEIAFVIHRSPALVNAYRRLRREFRDQPSARARLREILGRIRDSKLPRGRKKGGQTWSTEAAATKAPATGRPMTPANARPFAAPCAIYCTPSFRACSGRPSPSFSPTRSMLSTNVFIPRVRVCMQARSSGLPVAVDDPPNRDKRIENTRLVPVILDLVTPQDIDDTMQTGRHHARIRHNKILRLFRQA